MSDPLMWALHQRWEKIITSFKLSLHLIRVLKRLMISFIWNKLLRISLNYDELISTESELILYVFKNYLRNKQLISSLRHWMTETKHSLKSKILWLLNCRSKLSFKMWLIWAQNISEPKFEINFRNIWLN